MKIFIYSVALIIDASHVGSSLIWFKFNYMADSIEVYMVSNGKIAADRLLLDCYEWWSHAESNRRPLQCHRSALPTEL